MIDNAHQSALVKVEQDIYRVRSEGEEANPVALTAKGMVDIARVVAGGSFGALALIDGKPRLTTAKCLTRCHLLVLNRSDWRRSEHDIKRRKTSEKVQFVKKIPVFGKLSTTYLNQRLMPHFFDVDVLKHQVIMKEGDPADKVYIIKEGEFAVSKKLVQRDKVVEKNIQDILDNPQRACKLKNKFFKKNNVA